MSLQTKLAIFTTVITVVLLGYEAFKPSYEGKELPSEIVKFSQSKEMIDLRKVSLGL